mmetsp:Transcript_11746/g.50317  ORF Transcript_11746/g.50317 Transcript_11746/m.50317 type:complete len:267 (-) Transcript_11746:744-1544(-)
MVRAHEPLKGSHTLTPLCEHVTSVASFGDSAAARTSARCPAASRARARVGSASSFDPPSSSPSPSPAPAISHSSTALASVRTAMTTFTPGRFLSLERGANANPRVLDFVRTTAAKSTTSDASNTFAPSSSSDSSECSAFLSAFRFSLLRLARRLSRFDISRASRHRYTSTARPTVWTPRNVPFSSKRTVETRERSARRTKPIGVNSADASAMDTASLSRRAFVSSSEPGRLFPTAVSSFVSPSAASSSLKSPSPPKSPPRPATENT